MKKSFSIQIPQTCTENWNGMDQRPDGRYCSSCKKDLVDFSSMTDAALASFLQDNPTTVCGRFHADQLNRPITVPRKTLPWIKYFFSISIPAFLLSLKSNGQRTKMPTEILLRDRSDSMRVTTNKSGINHVFKGRVIDQKGEPVQAAAINILNSRIKTTTDSEGYFKLFLAHDSDIIRVTASWDYAVSEMAVGDKDYAVIILPQNPRMSLGYFSINQIKPKENKFSLTNLFTNKRKPVPSSLPKNQFYMPDLVVSANSSLYILWMYPIRDQHQAEIYSMAGNLVQTAFIVPVGEEKDASLYLKNLSSGSYRLRMSNLATGEVSSSVFQVN